MPEDKINILCTRPLDPILINNASENDIAIDCLSFIETQPILTEELTRQIQGLAEKKIVAIFTSMNAAEAVAQQLSAKPDWKIYCIGGTTKGLIYQYFGENAVAASAKNAAILAKKIIADKKNTEVFFFCGDHRLDELPELLKSQEIVVTELTVYSTIQLPYSIEKNYAAILFFSPSAVHSFFTANTISLNTIFFSIGKTTTACIRSYCNNTIITSEWPGKEHLLKMALDYFTKNKQIA